MFYSTNQPHHWKLNQSEIAISGRLANQKPGKKNQSERRIQKETANRPSPPFSYNIVCSTPRSHCGISKCTFDQQYKMLVGVFSTTSVSYNLLRTSPFTGYLPFPRHFHILQCMYIYIYIYICCVVLQGCPSPITFYELALSLVICPFPAIVFS